MAEDFRVSTSWFGHRKRKRLLRRLDHAGESALFRLWGYAASNRTDGDLSGLTHEDIADQADFRGDPDFLVSTLVACKLLDGEPGAYKLHDWEENQPWVAGEEERRRAARKAVHRRWMKEGRGHKPTPWCTEACDLMRTGTVIGKARRS